jgi:hypothetical protein
MCRGMTTKQELADQFHTIKRAIAAVSGGPLIEEIAATANPGLDRRTLQRRLEALIRAGDVIRAGKGHATRYLLRNTNLPAVADVGAQAFIISPNSIKVQAALRKPIQSRPVVGYNRSFLDDYRPNITAYLSDTEKAHLAQVGKPQFAAEAAGTFATNILSRLLIELSWGSSRLEGNTYSLLDTQRLVEFGQEAKGKDRREAQMILNHKAAIEFLVQSAGDIAFNRMTLLNLHALLADGLLEDAASPGRLRQILVAIGGSTYHPPGVPQMIEECFDQILSTAAAINDPFEQGLFAMVQLPYLQPFDDVNKRVSRLAANIPLIRGNWCPLSFMDVPTDLYTQAILGVYEMNDVALLKDVFIWAYERSASRYRVVRQQLGEPDAFRLRHRDTLRQVIGDVIRGAMDRQAAFLYVSGWASKNLPAAEAEQFRELAETELLSLHEGNFARFQARPSEFIAWQKIWQRAPR